MIFRIQRCFVVGDRVGWKAVTGLRMLLAQQGRQCYLRFGMEPLCRFSETVQ
jgi:hypothetical protein